MGGKYIDDDKPKKLNKWLDEKWVNVTAKKDTKAESSAKSRRASGGGGYEKCGTRSKDGKYPLCRPSVNVSSETPKRVQDISQTRLASVILKKQKLQNKGNVKF
jgi:hypothetical protein